MIICIGSTIHWDPHDPECNYEFCPMIREGKCSLEIKMPQGMFDQLVDWSGSIEGVSDLVDRMFPSEKAEAYVP
jgi:hypothetical protein